MRVEGEAGRDPVEEVGDRSPRSPPGPRRDLVAIGASAGGVEALQTVVGGLPAGFPASVVVVLHIMAEGSSLLPAILDRAGPLPAEAAADGQDLEPGRIYVAPPDRHVVVDGRAIRLDHGPREGGHRPGIDPLFRSAARSHGPRAIGVVLSGFQDDGAAGLAEIAEHGGATVVQDPADAAHPQMPRNAIAATRVDVVVSAARIAGALSELVSGTPPSSDSEATGPGALEEDDGG